MIKLASFSRVVKTYTFENWGVGIIGEYIGRIYFEVKKRPQFIIEEIINNNSNSIEK